jgi:hypothetical protein
VIVKATNSAGTTTAASAATTPILALLPSNTAVPTISGILKTGNVLTAATGTWTGTPPITYTYQWQLCSLLKTECKDVVNATKPTFLLELLNVGLTMRVVVTATNAAGSVPVPSAVTGLIAGLLLSPTSGPPAGGTAVALAAPGVGEATTVHFGSAPATAVEVVSPDEITAVAPPGSGTVPVTVTVSEGSTSPNPNDEFTYR